jgi:hypothetical protein
MLYTVIEGSLDEQDDISFQLCVYTQFGRKNLHEKLCRVETSGHFTNSFKCI